jgi:hypothetical protein
MPAQVGRRLQAAAAKPQDENCDGVFQGRIFEAETILAMNILQLGDFQKCFCKQLTATS